MIVVLMRESVKESFGQGTGG